jgi:hypothetical protein
LVSDGATNKKKDARSWSVFSISRYRIFSLIFIGFGCGKRQGIAGNGFAASVAVLIGTFASVVTLTPA